MNNIRNISGVDEVKNCDHMATRARDMENCTCDDNAWYIFVEFGKNCRNGM